MYDNGTSSRGVEDEDSPAISIVDLRDRLNSLGSLVHVCLSALSSRESLGQQYVQARVAEVLCDYVGPEIKKIEEELGHI